MGDKKFPKDYFFQYCRKNFIGLTFSDVNLYQRFSGVMPYEAVLDSRFSKNISLKIPIISAAMDTITESQMAIAMARAGGLGIIHRNLSVEEQACEVSRVKHELHGCIPDPKCVNENLTLEEVRNWRAEKGYNFDSFPVIDNNGTLVGLLTHQHFKFENLNARVCDIMSLDIISVSSEISINDAYTRMRMHKIGVLPVTDNDNKKVNGLYVWSDVERIKSGDMSVCNTDKNGRLVVGAAIGTGDEELARAEKLVAECVDVLVIDSAHGGKEEICCMIPEIKKLGVDVVVGNITTAESAHKLLLAGADGIKVGGGSGSICTTSQVTGVGRPQLTAIADCERVARDFNIPICSDGGIRDYGDIAKAIGAGAESIMSGRMFAGTKETPGEIVYREGRPVKVYRGMGSQSAMDGNEGSRKRYFQKQSGKTVPEGVEATVPYQGEVSEVLTKIVGALKSSCGYIGARTIDELREHAIFERATESGKQERAPHDVMVEG